MDKVFHENFEQCREQYLQNYVPYFSQKLKIPKRKKLGKTADIDVPTSKREEKANTKVN